MTIIEFLEARIAEDEAIAEDGPFGNGTSGLRIFESDLSFCVEIDTDRVRAECAAKRAIVAAHQWYDYTSDHPQGVCANCRGDEEDEWYREEWPCRTIKALAAIYKDHPDYNPDW